MNIPSAVTSCCSVCTDVILNSCDGAVATFFSDVWPACRANPVPAGTDDQLLHCGDEVSTEVQRYQSVPASYVPLQSAEREHQPGCLMCSWRSRWQRRYRRVSADVLRQHHKPAPAQRRARTARLDCCSRDGWSEPIFPGAGRRGIAQRHQCQSFRDWAAPSRQTRPARYLHL